MLLIPLRTDAPIYHWPWVTLIIIVANVVTFVTTGGGSVENFEMWEGWVLEYGNGLHPIEWISMNFLHFGWLHLIGNMIFLWGFGLVVEGKLGWWKYLLTYFGIGIVRAALEQTIMLGQVSEAVTGSGGASGIIYGLLAMSLVWAPKNEVTCFFLLVFRALVFDITIMTFSVYFIGMQIFVAALSGWAMSSEVIHLLGAVVGFALAAAMLKLDWVDCENWDLFAVMNGTYGSKDDYQAYLYGGGAAALLEQPNVTRYNVSTDTDGELETKPESQERISPARTLRKMRQFLHQGKARSAATEYGNLKRLGLEWHVDKPDLKELIDGLYKAQAWFEVVPLMEDFIERFPDSATRIRLKLAGIFVQEENRPRAALNVLKPIMNAQLPETLDSLRKKIVVRANKLNEEGTIELEGRAW